MKKVLTALCAGAIAVCSFATSSFAADTTLRLAHTAATSHAHHQAALLFAENVQKRTKGQVKVEVYPSGELGDQPALAEQITLGALDPKSRLIVPR